MRQADSDWDIGGTIVRKNPDGTWTIDDRAGSRKRVGFLCVDCGKPTWGEAAELQKQIADLTTANTTLRTERDAIHRYECGHMVDKIRRGDGSFIEPPPDRECQQCKRYNEAEAEITTLRAALAEVKNQINGDHCDCDHSTDACCAKVGAPCVECFVDAALVLASQEPTPSDRPTARCTMPHGPDQRCYGCDPHWAASRSGRQ